MNASEAFEIVDDVHLEDLDVNEALHQPVRSPHIRHGCENAPARLEELCTASSPHEVREPRRPPTPHLEDMRFDAQAAVAFEQSQEPLIPKAYQVRQVRDVIVRNGLGGEPEKEPPADTDEATDTGDGNGE